MGCTAARAAPSAVRFRSRCVAAHVAASLHCGGEGSSGFGVRLKLGSAGRNEHGRQLVWASAVASAPCTPAETGSLRKTPLIRSYEKQVIDLTEVRGSWNVAYIYNKELLRKASQHHRKVLLLCRAKCRWIAICYYKVR